jgi:orotate phosphoribosyltransferase-like protein
MNLQDIQERLQEIKEISWDDESAHVAEKMLLIDFVVHIRNSGVEPLCTLANEVLNVEDINFCRWYA